MVVQVAQCNIRSLNTSSKQIEDLCKLKQISILSLTEIWHPEVSSLKFLHKWNWNVSVRVNKEGGGAATIINPLLKTHPRKDLNNPGLEAALKSSLLCLRGSRTVSKVNGVDSDFGMALHDLGL